MKRALFAVVVAILASASAAAHHSYAAYHMDRLIEIEGELEEFEWVSPHSLLKVRTADALYTVEWRAPNAMARTGVQRDDLKNGDRLIVSGNPRRDIAESGVVNLKSVRRPADGWSWPVR